MIYNDYLYVNKQNELILFWKRKLIYNKVNVHHYGGTLIMMMTWTTFINLDWAYHISSYLTKTQAHKFVQEFLR